jgi:predicted phosphodiesterase
MGAQADIQRWAAMSFAVLVFGVACADQPLTTPPPERVTRVKDPTFELVVIGDYGSGDETEEAVAADVRRWVERHHTDAIVTTGDNVYPEGDEQFFEEAWFEPYGWVEDEGLPVFASLGNHDFEADEGRDIIDLFDLPGSYYETEIRDADIYVLNSNEVDEKVQKEWLEDRLATSDERWQIVAFHHPAFSCSKHGSTPRVIRHWVPLFEEYGVDLVLNGHDHNYQRFAPVGGVTYVVTGGGGDELYALDGCDLLAPERVAANDQDHHFVVVNGDESRLVVEAVAEDGDVIDSFSITTGSE